MYILAENHQRYVSSKSNLCSNRNLPPRNVRRHNPRDRTDFADCGRVHAHLPRLFQSRPDRSLTTVDLRFQHRWSRVLCSGDRVTVAAEPEARHIVAGGWTHGQQRAVTSERAVPSGPVVRLHRRPSLG